MLGFVLSSHLVGALRPLIQAVVQPEEDVQAGNSVQDGKYGRWWGAGDSGEEPLSMRSKTR